MALTILEIFLVSSSRPWSMDRFFGGLKSLFNKWKKSVTRFQCHFSFTLLLHLQKLVIKELWLKTEIWLHMAVKIDEQRISNYPFFPVDINKAFIKSSFQKDKINLNLLFGSVYRVFFLIRQSQHLINFSN